MASLSKNELAGDGFSIKNGLAGDGARIEERNVR
jgi:hypothetical protein